MFHLVKGQGPIILQHHQTVSQTSSTESLGGTASKPELWAGPIQRPESQDKGNICLGRGDLGETRLPLPAESTLASWIAVGIEIPLAWLGQGSGSG